MHLQITLPDRGEERLTSLQERFLKSGLESFNNEEIIELLLSLGLPPRKCKREVRECLEQFKNLRGLLTASAEELEQAGISRRGILCIEIMKKIPKEFLKQKIIGKPVYKSSEEIFEYLYYSMRDLKKEVFKVIYLDSQNQIIDTADLFEGTIESTPVHPREIVEATVKHGAVRLIFAHNHPAGDPTPSQSDKQLTRDLVFIGSVMQLKVLDHIIIGENRHFSFADAGLIKKYEDDFLNIRIKKMLQAEQRQLN